MTDRRYRLVLTGLSLLLVSVVAAAIALTPDGDATPFPEAIEGVFPRPGDAVVQQFTLQIDLAVDYALDLTVDGVVIPDDEISFQPLTGVYTWRPGPGRTFETWTAGPHDVAISWDRIAGLPDRGSFTWSFRVH